MIAGCPFCLAVGCPPATGQRGAVKAARSISPAPGSDETRSGSDRSLRYDPGTMSDELPALGDWHDTRRSLHAWSKVLSAVRGALTEPDPRWWHLSLRVTADGLGTGPLTTPAGELEARLDLRDHRLRLDGGDGTGASLPLPEAPAARRLGGWLLTRLAARGVEIETERAKWDDDGARSYDAAAATRYHRAAHLTARVLSSLRDGLGGERGPVQLWAHHFDISFELFGSRKAEWEGKQQQAQIGFGFFPGDDDAPEAYFYGTPWPFEDRLMETPLPASAAWQKEPWEGARLSYAAAVDGGSDLLSAFFRAVHEAGRTVLD